MRIAGSVGLPEETLKALTQSLKGAHWPKLALVLITPRQDDRAHAPYAAMILGTAEPILTPPAFGPAFGEAGTRALAELLQFLAKHQVKRLFETVASPGEMAALPAADEALVLRLAAARNPLHPERVPVG